ESEADGVAPAAAPGPPALEQLRSSETQEDERSRKRRLGELFDQIDEAVRRVLQILEHDEERALRRDPLDEAAPRADDLLAVLIRRGLLRCDRERDEHRVALAAGAVHHTADLSAHVFGRRVGRHADEIDEELAERTVGE